LKFPAPGNEREKDRRERQVKGKGVERGREDGRKEEGKSPITLSLKPQKP